MKQGGNRLSDAAECLGALLENTDFLGRQGNADILDRWRIPRSSRLLDGTQYTAALNALLAHMRRAESPDLNVVRALGRVNDKRAIRPLVSSASSALVRKDAALWEQAFNSLENQAWARSRSKLEDVLLATAMSARRSRDSKIRGRAIGYVRARAASSVMSAKVGKRWIQFKRR